MLKEFCCTINKYIEKIKGDGFVLQPIRIGSVEEYKTLINYLKSNKITNEIIIPKIVLQHLNKENIEVDQKFILEIEDITQLTNEELNDFMKTNEIESIEIKTGKKHNLSDTYSYPIYSTEEYIDMNNQVNNIVSYIDESMTDLEKILTVNYILGKSIIYEYDSSLLNAAIWEDNQNMVRWIIRRKNCM